MSKGLSGRCEEQWVEQWSCENQCCLRVFGLNSRFANGRNASRAAVGRVFPHLFRVDADKNNNSFFLLSHTNSPRPQSLERVGQDHQVHLWILRNRNKDISGSFLVLRRSHLLWPVDDSRRSQNDARPNCMSVPQSWAQTRHWFTQVSRTLAGHLW